MKIRKPILLLIAAVAALAFAAPSTAGAAEATCPAGARCPVATSITLTGKDIALTTSLVGSITCTTLNLVGVINTNNGTTFSAAGNNTNPVQAGCENGPGRPINVTNFNITNLQANETGTASLKFGTMSFTSEIDLPKGVTCKFTGTNVKFEYTKGTDNIEFVDAAGITSTGGCGTAKLDGEATLEKTTGGAAVLLD